MGKESGFAEGALDKVIRPHGGCATRCAMRSGGGHARPEPTGANWSLRGYLLRPAMASSTAQTAAVSCLSKPCAIAAV